MEISFCEVFCGFPLLRIEFLKLFLKKIEQYGWICFVLLTKRLSDPWSAGVAVIFGG